MRKNDFVHREDGTTIVQLTQGRICVLDTPDWENLKHKTWHVNSNYACSAFYHKKQKSPIRMHREIMHPPEDMLIDHINHDTLDNRRANLRICTKQQNQFNQQRKYSTKPGRKGVYFFKKTGKWYAQICLNGRNKHLGYYLTDVEAAQAYDDAAKSHFGEFACLNLA